MNVKIFSVLVILLQVCTITSVDLDIIDCGIDHALDVSEGDVELSQYPWVGILFYSYFGEDGDSRSVTTVILIHKEFVLAPAADIGPMPKANFRKSSRVLLGEGWNKPGRRVRNYVIHPEYGEKTNTVALVQLRDLVRDISMAPVCPPPNYLKNPEFYVIKMKEDFDLLEKEVVKVMHIPGKMCKDFYVATNLYTKLMRPTYVACAVSIKSDGVCVWGAGSALVSRDVWGRWQLLGMSVRGPGCGAPSRYLDMMSYYPWIESSLAKFNRITITQLNKQKYVLRAGPSVQKYGACDDEEKVNLVFREVMVLRTDNNQYQFMTYNLSLHQNVEFTCLTMDLINASASTEMRVKHICPRVGYGPACYTYKDSRFELSVYLMFSESCLFEMFAWGFTKNMTLIDIQEWKWEEGTYYEDFSISRVEYRGPTYMTDFGYEPLDIGMWVPDYDLWTTTEPHNYTTSTTPPSMVSRVAYRKTSSTIPTKKTPRRRIRTTTPTTTTKPTTSTSTTRAPPTTAAPPTTVPNDTSPTTLPPVTPPTTPPPDTPPPTPPPDTPPPTPPTPPPDTPPPTPPPDTPPPTPPTPPPDTPPPTPPPDTPPPTPPTPPPDTPPPTLPPVAPPTTPPPVTPPTTLSPDSTTTTQPPPPQVGRLRALAAATKAHALLYYLALVTFCL